MYKHGSQVPTIDEIRELLAPALKRGGAKRAIVFGSYARGDSDEHSDLDLIIVADTQQRFFRRHEAFSDLYDAWGKSVDLLVYTPDELERMLAERRAFIELALEEGAVIYEE